MINYKAPVPSEEAEQAALMRWAMYETGKWPALNLLYHIPNGGLRSKATAGKMKAVGQKKGVPDLHLPVPMGKYHGLYIELKRRSGSTPTQDQADWLKALDRRGYCVCWCRGWEAAAAVLVSYLTKGAITYHPTAGRAGKYHAGEEQGC